MQYKKREYVSTNTFESTYYTTFNSHLKYGNPVRVQNINGVKHLTILQKKTLRFVSSKPRIFHTSPLFSSLKILTSPGKIILKCYVLITKAITNFSLFLFNNWFTFLSEIHQCDTSSSAKGLLKTPIINTKNKW